jgi:hypothetical protein
MTDDFTHQNGFTMPFFMRSFQTVSPEVLSSLNLARSKIGNLPQIGRCKRRRSAGRDRATWITCRIWGSMPCISHPSSRLHQIMATTHTTTYASIRLFASDAIFDRLIHEAHERGMRVVLDGVFNHASRGFFPFHHILENGAVSPYLRLVLH